MTQRKCLNCGAPLSDEKFCPQCGQSSDTTRLELKSFLLDLIARLCRVNRGFFYTCGQLLVRPWKVIRDYIHGKRAAYTPPVQLLIILCFLSVILDHILGPSEELFPAEIQNELSKNPEPMIQYLGAFLKFYFNTPILQYILVFVPALPMLRLVFRKYGAGRFNSAEYLLAALYLSAAYLSAVIIVYPLDFLVKDYFSLTGLTELYLLVAGSVSIKHAFMERGVSLRRQLWLLLKYICGASVCYIIPGTLIALGIYFIFH